SCLLLIGAGLFARTFQNLKNIDLGFNAENVVTFGVRPGTVYDDARKIQTYRPFVGGLAAVPGGKAGRGTRQKVPTGGRWDGAVTIPGVEAREGNQPSSFFNAVTPGYFEALGIPVRAGRDLRWSDWGGSKKLCLVNEVLVNEYLGGANAVGRLMAQGTRNTPDMEIVGVFGNARYEDVRGAVPRQVFVAMDTVIRTIGGVNVFARIQGDPR